MLRFLFRRPRSIRVPIENGQVDIQKVKVTKNSRPIFRRYFLNFVITFCVVRTLSYVVSDDFKKTTTVLGKRAEEFKKERQTSQKAASQTDQWKQQHGELNKGKDTLKATSVEEILKGKDAAAITLPIWFRERQRRVYDSRDTEWLAVADLQQDKKRLSELKAKIVSDTTAQLREKRHHDSLMHIQFNKQVGVFLDIIPPVKTPITYEVPCILITPQKVSFAWRPMSPNASTRTERMFHPMIFARAFGKGLFSFWQTSYRITKARFMDMLNEKEKNITLRVSLVGRGTNKRMVGAALERKATEEEKLRLNLRASQMSDKAQKVMFPFLHGQYGSEGSRKAYRDFVYSMTHKDAIEQAVAVFNHVWFRYQIAAIQRSTPDICVIRGMIDMMGARGKYRLELEAYYLPSDDTFVGPPRITKSYVMVDVAKFKRQGGAGRPLIPQTSNPQGTIPDEKQTQGEPSAPTEKPSPGQNTGK